MAEWVLIPSLVSLRETFNRLNPDRDKSSDGSIGDTAHAASSSDHNPDETGTVPVHDADTRNEVHAIDVDETGPWPADSRGPFTMMRAVRQLVTDHREGREDRLRYIIYERTIWSASWGWGAREYTGANPHDHHAHFSGSYTSGREADDSRWNIGFVEDDMPTAEEIANETWGKLFTEYADTRADGRLDKRTASDVLFDTNRIAYNLAVAQGRRDAEEQARDAAQTELIRSIAALAGNPMTEAQYQELLDAMRAAAQQAGAAATARLEEKLDAQRQAIADAAQAEADRLAAG